MPYIICAERTEDGQALKETSKGIAERAHHPEELRDNKSLTIDAAYYLANQVGLVHSSHLLTPLFSAMPFCAVHRTITSDIS